jgi:DNA (cytosine-5)-methyltransferase 1
MIAGFDLVQRSRTPDRVSADVRLNSDRRLTGPFPVVADLCCGMGGLSLAAQQVGMTVAAGVDIGGDALRTFAQNFPGAEPIEATVGGTKAIQQCKAVLITHRSSGAPLVVLSGPPCQGFSVAGSHDPKDKRNKVLLGVARALETLRPHCALVENVRMLLAPKFRARVRHFENHLDRAGYHVLPVELNAKDYGVAQRRERAFLLVTTKALDADQVVRRLTELRQPEIPCSVSLDDLPFADSRGASYDDEVDSRRRFPNHLSMRHSAAVQEKIAAITPGTGPMSYRKLDPSKPANTLFSGHRAPPAHYAYPRSITVREAARLQGFPDDFPIYGSFANQMMQVTNAVPPPLARTVLQVLAEFTNLPFRHDA